MSTDAVYVTKTLRLEMAVSENPRMFCPWWLTENGNCVEQGNEDDEAEKKAKESAAKSAYERLQV